MNGKGQYFFKRSVIHDAPEKGAAYFNFTADVEIATFFICL